VFNFELYYFSSVKYLVLNYVVDNAYDPDAGASVLSINAEQISGVWCLTFTDNGQGMSPEVLYEMLR
jgi:C4-dicarboxylate-specific signal transduction histidine kinase